MPAAEAAVGIGGNVRDDAERSWNDLEHELRGYGSKPPKAPLLPRRHDGADGVVVDDGRARGREREPAAGAFAAARHGPHRRRAAALAPRRRDAWQACATVTAKLRAATRANHAALRQEEVEHELKLGPPYDLFGDAPVPDLRRARGRRGGRLRRYEADAADEANRLREVAR